ncbi:M56 family metallopeptidase [Streptomyces shenzhenensis]|uniref:M56 family metallopeptidase n=1 Tax=Streptomyces shenzhenensis TaxID=943815 RepID=UPI003D8DED17
MTAALVLAVYAVLVASAGPSVMLRAQWPQRAPRLGLAVWHALGLSFLLSVMLTLYGLAMPSRHLHLALVGLLHSCGIHGGAVATAADRVALALPVGVFAVFLACLCLRLTGNALARARHRHAVDLVGRKMPELGVTVLPYDQPAAYCLPGHGARIVVTEAALRDLTAAQLDAVLEHERGHVRGRHHLLLAVADAFRLAFPGVALARELHRQTGLLLEMAADDRALRRHGSASLASALVKLAQARTVWGA